MIVTQLLVAGLLAAVSAKFIYPENIEEVDRVLWTDFNLFAKKYNRQYDSDEEMFKRFQIYKDNLEHAKKLQENEMGTAIYGETQFSDMTPEEFEQTMLPYTWPKQTNRRLVDIEEFGVSTTYISRSIDWRKKGVVTEVADQEMCGGSWAFSAISNIESAWAIAKGDLVTLSAQQLLDCDSVDHGCGGGRAIDACSEIINHFGGLEKENDYPYTAKSGNCTMDKNKFVVYINDSVVLPSNEVKMAAWVATKGPISASLNSAPLAAYMGGIMHPWSLLCPMSGAGQAVVIVGYGTENGIPYWIIKNSWSSKWGEGGYLRLYRGTNTCGITATPSSAIVE